MRFVTFFLKVLMRLFQNVSDDGGDVDGDDGEQRVNHRRGDADDYDD